MDAFMSKVHTAPDFRWGPVATIATSVLSGLLIISLISPNLAQSIILIGLQLVGGLALICYVIAESTFLRSRILTAMLQYRDWAYNPRSNFTKAYLAIVGALGGTKPKLWSLQHCLPSLPVPELKNSLDNYLLSVQPLLTEEEFKETQKACKEFLTSGVGEQLNAVLKKRAETEKTSWLLEWWENLVYLKGRDPIAVQSNWYGADKIDPCVRFQTTRAANLISGVLKFKNLMDTEQLEPNRVQGTVPLCMWQYSRLFGTVRIPGEEMDRLEFNKSSKHIVVEYKNAYFKCDVYYDDGHVMTRNDLQYQFDHIKEIMDARKEDEDPNVSILTSDNRTNWYNNRKQLMEMDSVNEDTIRCIETALFVIHFDNSTPETVEELAHNGMHRHGNPLWFDKNFNLIFFANGRFTSNVDHTWSDASVMVHVFDFVFATEKSADHWVRVKNRSPLAHEPKELKFKLTPEMRAEIQAATGRFQMLAGNIDLHVLKFQQFGKGLIKKLGMSPDAFCQSAIQLAYYKLHNSFALTYEAAATVRFHHGRTETVRSLSNQLKKFCEAMHDKTKTPKEQLKLLKDSCKNHAKMMRAATNGDGFDRHMLGLRILAMGSGMPMPKIFTDKAYQFEYKLSTSQTPAGGMLGGGFGPLCKDGYGVSYVVAEDRLWFHLSTYKISEVTDGKKFEYALQEALLDMYDMCIASEDYEKVFSMRTYRIQRAGQDADD
eukprot:Nk52_evm21s2506 gene=Nk52_evmTU21s2506